MLASEHPQAIHLAREAVPLTEQLGLQQLRVRALDVLGYARAVSGDLGGLDDSKRAIALARESNAFSNLILAEINLRAAQFFLGQLDAASEALSMIGRDAASYGTATTGRWLRSAEAYEALLHGQWEEAAHILDEVIAEAEAGVAHYWDPACRALRASIELAHGDLERASVSSETALEHARRGKDPQILAPALAFRGIVLLAQGRQEEAARLASEVLALGSVPGSALLELFPPATPIEFAWLLRDLGREAELLSALESAPATPWLEAARAIAHGDFAHGAELVARIGAPSVEAYTRLRVAEELARAGHHTEAHEQLAQALVFFRKVGATRYIAQAEELLAASP